MTKYLSKQHKDEIQKQYNKSTLLEILIEMVIHIMFFINEEAKETV